MGVWHLLLPSLVHVLAAKDLALLQQHHVPPLGLVDRIDVAAGLDAEPGALGVRCGTVDRGNVDVLASVELKGGLGAVHFEVQAGVRVAELSKATHGQLARVKGNFGGVGFHDEDVVNVCTCCSQLKGVGHIAGEFVNVAVRDASVIEGQVVLSSQLGGGAGDGGSVTDVEVARPCIRMRMC